MASPVSKLVTNIVRLSGNNNPVTIEKKKADLIKNLRGMEHFFKTYIPPVGYKVEKYNVEGLPVELFKKKKGGNNKLVLVLHGGAYVTRLAFIYRWMNLTYSKATGGGSVMLIDYRCAPEHKYPCALEDALKAWDWALAQGYKPENIVTLGDSAGGHLNISLLMKLREQNRQMPAGAVFLSPWLDMTCKGQSYIDNYHLDPVFGEKGVKGTPEKVQNFADSGIYCWYGENDPYDPYISPVYAEFCDGYPPIFVTVGGNEMLLSDSKTLCEKIEKARGKATLKIIPEMFHVFNLYRVFPEARKAIKWVNEFLGETLK